MEIRNYAANASMTNQTSNTTMSNSDLKVDDFLQIMAAEIKNQTPFDSDGGGGGSNTGYLTQLAQFTMLEQMEGIAENLNVLTLMNQQVYTMAMIGKEVTVMGEEGEITGIVDKMRFENGYAVIQVNDESYNLGSIIDVANVEEADGEMCCNPECGPLDYDNLDEIDPYEYPDELDPEVSE